MMCQSSRANRFDEKLAEFLKGVFCLPASFGCILQEMRCAKIAFCVLGALITIRASQRAIALEMQKFKVRA
jgi:hypothetical protein